jgi:crotonobetainyl-CoA:carnitine CoA-transferase CaiB-like acyl-CoA transferase
MASPVPLPHPAGPLNGYRVLDLADEKGQLCARFLGELGADVIKVEPPREGDRTRENGPFYQGMEDRERSLYWWTMNAGKRSITLQLRLEAGRQLFHRLAAQSDIIIETEPPGAAREKGLDYPTLEAVNPGIILVSITGFGQDGPYAGYQATDIVGAAMGGLMYLNGDDERGPVRTTAPQAYTQVNIQAAVGAMIALFARGTNGGTGQHVDVSMQEAAANALDNASATWDILKVNNRGPGLRRMIGGNLGARYLFETSDGWVAALQAGGIFGLTANIVIDWMAETGEAGDLDTPAWRERLSALVPLDEADRTHVEEVFAAFVRKRKKLPLTEEAQRRGLGWAPVQSPRELAECQHLAARGYWTPVQHEDLGATFTYPGAPWKLSATPWRQRGRAPHVGEHNEEVYGELLGLDAAGLRRLRMRMVV